MDRAGSPPPYPPVPETFVGVWQRTLLEVRGAPAEAGSQVFWLQTRHWHGDLRLPANRPDFSGCARTSDCTPTQQLWLAGQKGFAGLTEVTCAGDATFCQWHRQVDFQPPRPDRDFGRIVLAGDGNMMEEFGVDTDYREIWLRLDDGSGPSAALRRADPGSAGLGELLLVAGKRFFHLRDRRQPLAPDESLAVLAARATAAVHLDMALSYGIWHRDSGTGIVTHSTLPWCEGRTVDARGWREFS